MIKFWELNNEQIKEEINKLPCDSSNKEYAFLVNAYFENTGFDCIKTRNELNITDRTLQLCSALACSDEEYAELLEKFKKQDKYEDYLKSIGYR